MSGLLSGVLPAVFSQADRAKRYIGGLLSDPVGRMQQSGGQAVDDLTKIGLLTEQAFTDKKNPMRPTDNAAYRQLVDTYLNSVLNFAPAGVTVKGPQSEALEKARKNAVKMLGLPENNTPMDRARALGFADDAYHGTPDDRLVRSRQFKNEMLGKSTRVKDAELGHFTASNGKAASEYTWRDGDMTGNVLPLMLRGDKQTVRIPGEWAPGKFDAAIQRAREGGADYLNIEGVTTLGTPGDYQVVFNPANIRSRFAAFDPARVNEADLLGRADPRLLALLGIGAGGAAYYGSDK